MKVISISKKILRVQILLRRHVSIAPIFILSESERPPAFAPMSFRRSPPPLPAAQLPVIGEWYLPTVHFLLSFYMPARSCSRCMGRILTSSIIGILFYLDQRLPSFWLPRSALPLLLSWGLFLRVLLRYRFQTSEAAVAAAVATATWRLHFCDIHLDFDILLSRRSEFRHC